MGHRCAARCAAAGRYCGSTVLGLGLGGCQRCNRTGRQASTPQAPAHLRRCRDSSFARALLQQSTSPAVAVAPRPARTPPWVPARPPCPALRCRPLPALGQCHQQSQPCSLLQGGAAAPTLAAGYAAGATAATRTATAAWAHPSASQSALAWLRNAPPVLPATTCTANAQALLAPAAALLPSQCPFRLFSPTAPSAGPHLRPAPCPVLQGRLPAGVHHAQVQRPRHCRPHGPAHHRTHEPRPRHRPVDRKHAGHLPHVWRRRLCCEHTLLRRRICRWIPLSGAGRAGEGLVT